MPQRVMLVFDISDYGGYDDTTKTSVMLTSKQAAILSSVAVLLLYRGGWGAMSDSDWDNLSSELSDIIDIVDNAI